MPCIGGQAYNFQTASPIFMCFLYALVNIRGIKNIGIDVLADTIKRIKKTIVMKLKTSE